MNLKEWKIAGTFVTGISHEKQNIGCHDRFSYKKLNDITSISLADGAGSVKYPEIGADIASVYINNILSKNFDWIFYASAEKAIYKLTHPIRSLIGKQAKKKNSTLRDFATTLIFASVKDDKFIAGHIGDGILACLKKDEIQLMSPPDNGEFVNETYFITSNSYKMHFRIFKGNLDEIDGFVLMSDGTCESLFDKKNRKLAPVVLTLFEWLDNFPTEEVEKALKENFEKLIKKKTTDDCSIVLMKLANYNQQITVENA